MESNPLSSLQSPSSEPAAPTQVAEPEPAQPAQPAQLAQPAQPAQPAQELMAMDSLPSPKAPAPVESILNTVSKPVTTVAEAPSDAQTNQTSLKWFAGAHPLQTSLKGLKASEFFLQHTKGQATPSLSDRPRCEMAVKAFHAVAHPEEKELLKSNTATDVQLTELARILHDRVVGRLLQAWKNIDPRSQPPKSLTKFKAMLVNSVNDRLGELEKVKKGIRAELLTSLKRKEIEQLPAPPSKKRKDE